MWILLAKRAAAWWNRETAAKGRIMNAITLTQRG
jgi:hypothetical protein